MNCGEGGRRGGGGRGWGRGRHAGGLSSATHVLGHGVDRLVGREGEARVLEERRRHPERRVRVEEAPVEVVRDLAAVLNLGDHVLDGRPRDRARVEVLLEEEEARRQVAVVELVLRRGGRATVGGGGGPPTRRPPTHRHAESERAELAALLDDRVEEAEHVDELAPLRRVDALEAVLVDDRLEGAHDACLHARGRLVRALERELEEAEREADVRERRDEEAEVRVDRVAHLQEHVCARGGGRGVGPLRSSNMRARPTHPRGSP